MSLAAFALGLAVIALSGVALACVAAWMADGYGGTRHRKGPDA